MGKDTPRSAAPRGGKARLKELAPGLPIPFAVVSGLGLAYEIVTEAGDSTGPRWLWLLCGSLAVIACIQRAVLRRYDQFGWIMLAGTTVVAMVARLNGDLVPAAVGVTGIGHTAGTVFPVLLVASSCLVLHARTPGATWAMRVEGATGLLGGVAVSALLLGEAGRTSMVGLPTDVTIAPVLVVLMTGAAVGCLTWGAGRGGKASWILVAAMLCVGLSSTAAIVGIKGSTDLLGPAWSLAIALICVAAAVDNENEPINAWSFGLFDSSLVMGFLSLTVIIWGLGHTIGPWASIPAVLTLVSVSIRGVLTRYDARSLTASRHQARTDDLTGLANRRYFYERVEEALAGRNRNDRMAVLVIDLDRFKEINDSLGHHAGDEVLRLIGPRLAGAVGVRDVLSRLGGDEFAVLIEGGDEDWVLRTANGVRDALTLPFLIGDVQLTVDASVGVAMWPHHAYTLDDLMARADIAMYRAKSERSGVRTYEERGDAPTWERLHLLELLRTAVHSDDPIAHGLVVHYQPKLEVKSGAVVGVEALVRFDHPDGTMLFPDLFIAMVENAGLMMDLTLSVLRIAIRQCTEWRRNGIMLNVAVNVSTSNLLDLAFPHQVMRLLKESDLSPSMLAIEVTESSLMQDRVRCLDVLHRLRAIGIKISVDDYGTGHSSLAYLKDLPADELKLDRTFVQGMAEDPKVSAIVESTVALAHALDLSIVAEGVETDDDLDRLRQFDVDVVQGYLFSRALSPEETLAWFMKSFNDSVVPPVEESPVTEEAEAAPHQSLFGRSTDADLDDEHELVYIVSPEEAEQQEVVEPIFEIQGIDWIPLDAS